MEGGTSFTFVTGGLAAAIEQASAAAADRDVAIAGGASVVRQAIAAGFLEELHLHVAPVLLGAGEPIFEDIGDPLIEPLAASASPAVTHVSYRIRPRA
jgi:dihydrofolate reductase